jgi:hypothetical protein
MNISKRNSVDVGVTSLSGMGLVYVAAPYTSRGASRVSPEDRISIINRCIGELIRKDVMAVSPLLMHSVLRATPDLPSNWEWWQAYSITLLRQCKAMVVLTLPDWDQSVGVRAEIEYAKFQNIPVLYVKPDELLYQSADLPLLLPQ